MALPTSDLETALTGMPAAAALPPELPVAHLTIARWLNSIINAGALLPRQCGIFNEELLYFSYGGVFFRTQKAQSERASELPVALVFTPEVLDRCTKLYPFDSGAMMKRLFGDVWYDAMYPFEKRFVVTSGLSEAARALVSSLYGSNNRYVRGRPRKDSGDLGSIMQLLRTFLTRICLRFVRIEVGLITAKDP